MTTSRVTFTSNLLIIQDNIRKVQSDYNLATIPATTGLRINTLSDDTSQISRLFSLRSLINDSAQYQKNITSTRRFMSFVENRLTQGSDVLERIREVALRASDATVSSAQRQQMSDQLDDLKTEFLGHANANVDNRYIFAGAKFSTIPFSGTPTVFNGNNTITNNQVTSTLQISTNLDGEEVFIGNVDTAVGTDLATTLKDSDGVSLGLSNGDTITVAGTIGGAFSTTFSITSTTTLTDMATQLQTILRANGAGTETVTVQGDGSLRVTAGATQIDDLTMSISGNTAFNTAFTYGTTIAALGTDDSDTLLSGSGEDIFDVIDDIQTAIASGDIDSIATHMDRLDNAIEQLTAARTKIGTRQQQLDAVELALSEDSLKFTSDLSDIQDANIDQVMTKLVSQETALRVVYSASSRILQTASNLQLNV